MILLPELKKCKQFKLYIECFNKVNAELLDMINEHTVKSHEIIKFKFGDDFTTDDFVALRIYLKNDKLDIFKNKFLRV